jgi:hypothetical protein
MGLQSLGRPRLDLPRLGLASLGQPSLGLASLGQPRLGLPRLGGSRVVVMRRQVGAATRRTTYLVGAMLLVGMALAAAVAPVYGSARAPLPAPGWLPQPWLTLVLVVLTATAELVYVRIDHDGQAEYLGLFEAAVVVDVLLLPPLPATAVAVVAIAAASCIRRSPLVKSLYNLGMYAASTAALVLIVSAFRGPGGGFSARLVLVLLAGTVAFAAVNLCCLAVALAATSNASARAVVDADRGAGPLGPRPAGLHLPAGGVPDLRLPRPRPADRRSAALRPAADPLRGPRRPPRRRRPALHLRQHRL